MERGQVLELKIEDMSSEGQGIGKTDDGFVVFVPGAVVGDLVRVSLTKVKKNYAFARLEDVIELSEFRNDDFYCQICGGCPMGLLQYDKQLGIKERQVREKLERIAGLSFCENDDEGPVFRPIAGMKEDDNDGDGPIRYRNKAVLSVAHDRSGTLIGFNRARSHDVIDCPDCLLQPLTVAAATEATRRFIEETKGWIKGMTVKTAFGTGQVMVVYELVDKSAVEKITAEGELLVDLLDEAIYNVGSYDDGEPAFTLESIALMWEKGGSKGGQKRYDTTILAGGNTIIDEITIPDEQEPLTLRFEISPQSFYQVNTAQMQRLYGIVRDYCRKSIGGNKPAVLDLYCGVGTIGLCLADVSEKVIGIEVVKDAVIDANRNAVINGIVNAVYVCGKAEEEIGTVIGQLPDSYKGWDDVIAVLDPPRAGCRPELLQAIAKAGVGNVIYVSCDPATLARDLKLLGELGYKVIEATPVDMFPQTGHIECACLLDKKKPKDYVEIGVDA